MPTTRPRHTLTETDAITRALEDAAHRWPEDSTAPGKLLLHLVEEGHQAIKDEQHEDTERRREAVRLTSGKLTGMYPPGYLADLRADWPE